MQFQFVEKKYFTTVYQEKKSKYSEYNIFYNILLIFQCFVKKPIPKCCNFNIFRQIFLNGYSFYNFIDTAYFDKYFAIYQAPALGIQNCGIYKNSTDYSSDNYDCRLTCFYQKKHFVLVRFYDPNFINSLPPLPAITLHQVL